MFKKKELTRLGDILVSKGLITPIQLEFAIKEQSRRKQLALSTDPGAQVAPIGEILIELGYIDRLQLKRGLNWQQRLRHASIAMALCAPFMIFSPSAAASVVRPAPITVEAENYSAMKGVVNEATTDFGGGQSVGYIDSGDWMNYDALNLNLTKDTAYKITLRIASLNGGGSVQIKDLTTGNVIDTVPIPKTDGWKTWVDVERTVTLPAGTNNLQLFVVTGGFNLNWFKLENIEPEAELIPEAVVSRVIEAESFSSMNGVVLEATKDVGGGKDVSYIDTGDWMNYENADLLIPRTAVYKVTYRVAALNAGGVIELKDIMSGALLDTVSVPKTDGWQTWVDVVREVTLPQGLTKLQVFAKVGGFNFNLFKVESIASPSGGATPPTTPPAAVATPETIFPYVLQTENYSSMAGIKTEKTSDVGGGLNVGYIEAGDWMSYSTSKIKAPFTGKYKVSYRVASLTGGADFAFNDITTNTTIGTVTVPKTGGWQQWQTIETEVNLTAGDHTFTLVAKTGSANINWIQIEPISTPLPLTIQAEDYSSMLGVKVEKTADVSGVSNVGYIESGDWMAYDNVEILVPNTRTYKVTYRVATNAAGAIVQLHSTDTGTVFDAATLPNTAGWQKWVDVERTVTLPAGKHHFGIKSAKGGFNINWFKVEAIDSAATSSASSTVSSSNSSSSSSVSSSSSSTVTVSSSSSSTPVMSSSKSSSSAGSGTSYHVGGKVNLSWNVPNQRENGTYLDVTEVGGYEIRYKKTTDKRFTYISISGYSNTQHSFDWLEEGDYIFQIAAFDKNGIYSSFVDIRNQ